ncbi:flavodoxin [Siminovitchia sediminis]|uniref:Flavodoxin n=1 Tax=Siminovitchia sediminis TaxID=1274353 RepID=A0ABW4KE49_9BACI
MKRILLLYASMTGNTEEMANIAGKYLEEQGIPVTRKCFDADNIQAEELTEYDGIMFGTYTYDDGDLPWEVEDFYEDLLKIDLTGKRVAVFGSGDSFYPEFGKAVDTMAARFQEVGAVLVDDCVIADLGPDAEDAKRCEELVRVFVKK